MFFNSLNPHIPQCVPYAIEDVLVDLVVFAAQTLLVGGRLVYWLPTTTEYVFDIWNFIMFYSVFF